MANYLDKGAMIYVEGRLQTRSWEDRDGVKKYTTEVVANIVTPLGGGGGGGGRSQDSGGFTPGPSSEPAGGGGGVGGGDEDEPLPF